jgi:hypothetical protein
MRDHSEPWKIRWALILLLAGGGLTLLVDGYAQGGGSEVYLSRSGKFMAHYSSELDPLVINRIHYGVLQLETRSGAAVDGARIRITGGMPEHKHGLPTQPEVTRYLGDGKYLIEGLRFHMQGAWELLITIEVDGTQDIIRIPLQL